VGIIGKQTIKGSFFSYLGVAVGFLTVGILWPRLMEPEEIGVITLLIAISAILAQVGSLGINSVCVRLFPYFRDNKTRHHGFLRLGLLYLSVGIIIIFFYYFLFKGKIVANNTEKSILFARYAYLIIPFTVATLLFTFFDSLHKLIYNAVVGLFLKEFIFRLLNLFLILLYAWLAFSFSLFMNFYFIIFSIPALGLIILLYRTRQFNLSADPGFVKKDMRRSLVDVSLFGLIGGMGTLIISNIDKIMINRLIDLEATGIYSIAFLFGTIITLPARPLSKIATTILAESWKKNDTDTIRTIYTKSSLNQLIFAGLIFLLVWLNVDIVFMLIPQEYEAGKWVIFFISLSGVILMGTGLNGFIITSSRYYRYQALFVLILLVVVVITNIVFIPMWGITGAAIAALVSNVIFNLTRVIFLYVKFKMQPFNYKFLVVIGLLLVSLLAGHYLQGIGHWLLRTAIICTMVLLLYMIPILALRISGDLNNSLLGLYKSFLKRDSK
jgi:O-antigen/teichoic acid export membrane protein